MVTPWKVVKEVMLKDKIIQRKAGILTYGLTPPKQNNTTEKISEIAKKQLERINTVAIDAVILYDVQEESDRVKYERPFPYLETVDPTVFSEKYLQPLNIPRIVYRCVGKYTKEQLAQWITTNSQQEQYSVFVGASSSDQQVNLKLADAYKLNEQLNSKLLLGGVIIPERHLKYNDEHLRVIKKVASGCKFFVSQAVYNVEAAKNFLSDYYYYCQHNNMEMVPILFNFTPCGSLKTLEFMKWLGINIPRWLENELINANDILDTSITLSKDIFQELLDFGLEKGIPIGCSIESVSTRKVEIDASIQLVQDIGHILTKKLREKSMIADFIRS